MGQIHRKKPTPGPVIKSMEFIFSRFLKLSSYNLSIKLGGKLLQAKVR